MALPLGVWFFTVSRTVEKEPGETEGRIESKTGKARRRKIPSLFLGAAVAFLVCFLAGVFLLPWKGEITPAYLYRTDLYTDDQVEQLGLGTMLIQDLRHSLFGVPEQEMPQVEEQAEAAEASGEAKEEEFGYNMLDIDFDALAASASSEEEKWLSEYFGSLQPVRQKNLPACLRDTM